MSLNLVQHLEREFEQCDALELPNMGLKPLVVPGSEEELCEVLRFAGRERKSVLPVGYGSKLSWLPDLESVGFLLSTRALRGVVAYEPGDGTLTARAGCTMSELESEVARGGHHLTPQVALGMPSSLGGVLASDQSGLDRGPLGPARHHVLGMRVALADGRVVRSGGRLVKNVTGFDMHRAYAGSYGSLCVILEASLRLFPKHESECLVHAKFADAASAQEAYGKLRQANLSTGFVLLHVNDAHSELIVHLSGREEPVAWLRERVAELLPSASTDSGSDCQERLRQLRELEVVENNWSDLRITMQPSRSPEVLAKLRTVIENSEIWIRPDVAEFFVHLPEPMEEAPLAELERELHQVGARVWRRGSTPKIRTNGLHPSKAAARIMERLKRELDPDSVFAGSIPTPITTTLA